MSEGRIVGNRYRLGEVLGRGGMGEVLLAEDLQLRRTVAVKMLHADLLDHRDTRRRFEDEARAAARLTHPNVVGVYDIGEHRGAPYLVMERMDGPSLAAVLTRGPLPAERVRRLGLDVLGALAAAHAEGIVHRDIKPSNVLLTSMGDAKLADFGAAKSNRGRSHTVFGVVVGTPAYLAPERLAGEAASTRSDLYSVGVLLYEALAGRRPFSADSALRALSAANRAELDRWYQGQPTEALLAAVIERAIEVDPAARYGSAAEMAHALSEPTGDHDLAPTEFLQLSTLFREPPRPDQESSDGEASDPTLFDRRATPDDRRGSVGERRHGADRRVGAQHDLHDLADSGADLDGRRHSMREITDESAGYTPTRPVAARSPLRRFLQDPAQQAERRRVGVILGAAVALGLSITLAKAFDDPPAAMPGAASPAAPIPAGPAGASLLIANDGLNGAQTAASVAPPSPGVTSVPSSAPPAATVPAVPPTATAVAPPTTAPPAPATASPPPTGPAANPSVPASVLPGVATAKPISPSLDRALADLEALAER